MSALTHNNAPAQYKVLRYLAWSDITMASGTPVGYAITLDLGTTGLNLNNDTITDIAWTIAGYNSNHQICTGFGPHIWSANKSVDVDGVTKTSLNDLVFNLSRADIVIAHNAAFDRHMLQKLLQQQLDLRSLNWACTLNDLDWRSVGLTDRRLSDVIDAYGHCYKRHNTMEDCMALTWLLTKQWPTALQDPFPYPAPPIRSDQPAYHHVTNLSMLIRNCSAKGAPSSGVVIRPTHFTDPTIKH